MLSLDVEAQVGALFLQASLPKGKGTTVVVGPNGAGKSSLLKSILGEIRPSRGTISLRDRTLFCQSGGVNLPTEHRRIGYVPQKYALFPHMTVLQNVSFGLRGMKRKEREAKAMELLTDLRIQHLASRRTPALSGGESQRVALARALAIGPDALLLDEPMAALDTDARRKVRQFLAVRLRALGLPTIVVSHDIQDAEVLGDRVAVLEGGRIVQVGKLEELRKTPATDFVEQFLDTKRQVRPGPVAELGALPG